MNCLRSVCMIAIVCGLVIPVAAQEAPAPAGETDHVANIKQSLQASMAAIRQYQWVETTVVSMKGEEKSRTQKSCRYGADGKVVKTAMGEPPEEGKKPRGLRGKVAKKKKADVSESMQEAVELVKQYVPPQPEKIEAAKADGRLSVNPPDANGIMHIVIRDYLKEGDSVTFNVNAGADRFSGMEVSSYVDKAKNAVDLKVSMGALTDGTIYAEKINLDVTSENLGVAIENSGHTKVGG